MTDLSTYIKNNIRSILLAMQMQGIWGVCSLISVTELRTFPCCGGILAKPDTKVIVLDESMRPAKYMASKWGTQAISRESIPSTKSRWWHYLNAETGDVHLIDITYWHTHSGIVRFELFVLISEIICGRFHRQRIALSK